MSDAEDSRRDNFNLIRLLLATGVVVSHSFGVVGRPEPQVMLHSLGNLSVNGFFFLSGYMITLSARRLPVGIFLLHRVLRIAPALIVAMPFSYWVASWFNNFLGNPLHLINGVVWTIPWEATCYLLCAAAGLLGILERDRFAPFFAALLLVAFFNSSFQSESYQVLLPLFLLFASGAFFALNPDLPIKRLAPIAAILAVAIHFEPRTHWLTTALSNVPFVYAPQGDVGLPILLSLGHVFCISVLLMWFGKVVRPLFSTSLDLSYGVYLYAFPLQQAVVAILLSHSLPLSPAAVFVPSFMLSLIAACISWFLVERPALSLKSWAKATELRRAASYLHRTFEGGPRAASAADTR